MNVQDDSGAGVTADLTNCRDPRKKEAISDASRQKNKLERTAAKLTQRKKKW